MAAPEACTASRAADIKESMTSVCVRRWAMEAVNPWRRDRRCRTVASCGSTGTYYLDYICATYYTAVFWGLNPGGATPPPTTTTTTQPPVQCFTASNYAHTVAGRAYQSGGYTYAVGSNDAMGLWNVAVTTNLAETSAGYYQVVASC